MEKYANGINYKKEKNGTIISSGKENMKTKTVNNKKN